MLWVAAARRKAPAGTLEVSELATIYKQMYEAEGKKISKEQVLVLYWSAEQAEGVVVAAEWWWLQIQQEIEKAIKQIDQNSDGKVKRLAHCILH